MSKMNADCRFSVDLHKFWCWKTCTRVYHHDWHLRLDTYVTWIIMRCWNEEASRSSPSVEEHNLYVDAWNVGCCTEDLDDITWPVAQFEVKANMSSAHNQSRQMMREAQVIFIVTLHLFFIGWWACLQIWVLKHHTLWDFILEIYQPEIQMIFVFSYVSSTAVAAHALLLRKGLWVTLATKAFLAYCFQHFLSHAFHKLFNFILSVSFCLLCSLHSHTSYFLFLIEWMISQAL